MTKRDETVFAKTFEKMESEGCFEELRAKAKHKPAARACHKVKSIQDKPIVLTKLPASRAGKKLPKKTSGSQSIAKKSPLAASKK